MKDKVVSHVKFTIKDRCVSDFVASAATLNNDPLFANLLTFKIQPEENVFIVTNIYDDIDQVMSIQDKALEWLDSVEHLLVCNDREVELKLGQGQQHGRCEAIPCQLYQ